MSTHKIKLALEQGESYVVAPIEVWQDLVYTINAVSEQHEEGSNERSIWLNFANFFESQYVANIAQDNFEEEDGWL